MDIVINKLSAIESAAVKITNGAAEEKKELEQQMQDRLTEFDEQKDAETEKELARIQSELGQEMSKSLEDLRTETDRVIKSIESDYQLNHDKLSDEVLKKLIEV